MVHFRLLILGCIVVAIGQGCSPAPTPTPPADPDIIATVGTRVIRVEDLEQELRFRQETATGTINKAEVLDEMIRRQALVNQAIQQGFNDDPEIIKAWENSLIGKLREAELVPTLSQVKVSESELAKKFEEIRGKYTRPPQVRLAVLALHTDPSTSADRREELRSRMRQAREKALLLPSETQGFGPLPIEYSEDQATRYKGGDIGWVEQDANNTTLDPKVLEQGFALAQTGDITPVIEGQAGFYLVKLLERRGPREPEFEQFAPNLRQIVVREKQQQLEADFLEKIRASTTVQVNIQSLSQVVLPTANPDLKTTPPAFP